LLGRAEREFAQGKLAEACALAMKARGVKGYERAPETLEFLRRVGAKGVRTRLHGGWQRLHFEGSAGALAVAMAPDGSQVLSGHAGGMVKRWDPGTGRCAGTATLEGGLPVRLRCLTPDGLFGLEAAGKSLRVLERSTGKVAAELAGHGQDITAVCLSPDGGLAYTAGEDGVRSWELDWEYAFTGASPGGGKAGGTSEPLITRRAALVIAGIVVAAVVAGLELLWHMPQRADRLTSVEAGAAPAPTVPVKEEARPRAAAGKAGIEWVTIPGGSFMMGADDLGPWAQPRHKVTVQTFQMAKTLVTNKQYQACVEAGACTAAHVSDGACYASNGRSTSLGNLPDSFQGGDQPVVCVDWEQATAFSRWAGGRLPSEAEWEYAARSAGKDWKYPWGNEDATCERAVILGCGSATAPVCSKPAGNTQQGLCDMAGNVYEWVQDWHHDSYNGAPTDGSAWESPAGSDRVSRGGSWGIEAWRARSDRRGSNAPGHHGASLGLRPSRSR
jgi:formylglycine-generating enzyme required for sulfatase activity